MTLDECFKFAEKVTKDIPEKDIRMIRMDPFSVEVEVYERNEQGSKFVRDDGFVATRTEVFRP